ncbi:hypothetical protein F5B20DRAFT_113320 [Whalleya microplaca]|nr:hypothetical protein F5B20DRAFT_113320 [Whalleya microplaca]
MVSFFGLKIGGDKKRKSSKDAGIPTPQARKQHDQSSSSEGELAGKNRGRKESNAGSISYGPRPGTSHSPKTVVSKVGASPYISDARSLAASTSVLPQSAEFCDSSPSSLKQHASNPSFGTRWDDSSTSDLPPPLPHPHLGTHWNNNSAPALPPPVPVRSSARPGSSESQKKWIDPLDMHNVKGPLPTLEPASKSVSSAPKSPLGKYELNLNLPSDSCSLFKNTDDGSELPEPLHIKKQGLSPSLIESQKRSQSPRKPPSPPQSIKATEDVEGLTLGRPVIPGNLDLRPSSRGSHRNVPISLKELRDADDMSYWGPTSIPSPSSTPRVSEEKFSGISMNQWGEPVVQNVAARRDTFTRDAPRRRSLEMKVEEDCEKPTSPQRPKTSGERRPQRSERPPPLNLSPRPSTQEWFAPRTAPFTKGQRPQTPTNAGLRRPERVGPPAAAVGALGRPTRPDTSGVRRPPPEEYAYPPGRLSEDNSDSERPMSPDSPLLPLTGPLSGSPRIMPMESKLAPPPRTARSQLRIDTPIQDSASLKDDLNPPDFVSPPKRNNRNVPTPDSADWPLPSPTISSFDLSLRAESPFEPPSMPAVRAESPFGSRLPGSCRAGSPFGLGTFNRPWTPSNDSFSRPWTPTNERSFSRPGTPTGPWTPTNGPLRREVRAPPKRSETVPVSSPRQGSDMSPRTLPVRAATVDDRGLRSPAIVGDDFGGGFI